MRISLQEFLADAGDPQVRAWDDGIPKTQIETGKVVEVGQLAREYTAILEYELPMESRRPDVAGPGLRTAPAPPTAARSPERR